jgi:hypothetical protein
MIISYLLQISCTNFINRNRFYLCVYFSVLLLIGCETEKKNLNFQTDAAQAEYLHQAMFGLTRVIKHDNFPPMIASRIYAYAHLAAYEALVPNNPQYPSFANRLNQLRDLPRPDAQMVYCFPLASVRAYLKVGRALTFSEDSIAQVEKEILTQFQALNMPQDVYKRSLAYGDTLAAKILAWSKGDNYAQLRSASKYTVTPANPARWRPTAPGYDDALEPHWHKIRPLILDSSAQFRPVPPTPFDTLVGSKFYKEAYETFRAVRDSTPENVATAWYWDDNPVAMRNAGHVNFIIKKVSPGGHWLHINAYTARQKNADIFQTAQAYALISVGIFDAFISCWHEKYRSEVIRPESYIGKYIAPKDPKNTNWEPLLVTPPFPEYTSGHSVISGASSEIMAQIWGENTAFTDSTEVQFGIPARTFSSFKAAAEQAAISRLYGGIHYRPAIAEGLVQGQRVGQYVLKKLHKTQ